MQPGDDRAGDDVLDARGERARVGRREHARRCERELGGDGEHRRLPDRVAELPHGVERGVRVRREHDEDLRAAGVGVRRPLDAELARRLRSALGVARADHDLVAARGQPLRERTAEAARAADEGDPHPAASSTAAASLRDAGRSTISVSVTTRGTSASAGASVRSITRTSTTPS